MVGRLLEVVVVRVVDELEELDEVLGRELLELEEVLGRLLEVLEDVDDDVATGRELDVLELLVADG